MSGELITIDQYCKLEKTSLVFKRDISQDEWMTVFKALKTVEGCVQFWIGDCLAYRQQKWGMYDDIAEETGMDKKTLWEYKNVSESVKPSARAEHLSYTHHREVAALPPEKQELFLQKAVDEKLSVRELREEIKKDKKAEIKQPEFPSGKYQVIYADPPWPISETQWDKWESKITDKYPTMSLEDIVALPVGDLSDENCSLFLWTTNTFLHDAFHVMEAWGFKYYCTITWDKGGGWTQDGFHKNAEYLLFGYKGKMGIEQRGDSIPTVYYEKKGKHSKKPNGLIEIIKNKTKGNRIELFQREKQDGFDGWGNEV